MKTNIRNTHQLKAYLQVQRIIYLLLLMRIVASYKLRENERIRTRMKNRKDVDRTQMNADKRRNDRINVMNCFYRDKNNLKNQRQSAQICVPFHFFVSTPTGTTNYTYDSENRLVQLVTPNSQLVTYYYDPFGRRLWKEVSGDRTHFLYSDEGLVGEYNSTGVEIKTYGYQPNSTWTTDPLFMKQGSEYYFYRNDHLGTPMQIANVDGNIVWSATYDAFGNAQIGVVTVENNLRFPGQYYDSETGLHYNWYRYYDPGTGRYLRTDPIGFAGGDINLFEYANNSPVNWVDFFGLQKCKSILEMKYLKGFFGSLGIKLYGVGFNLDINFGRSEEGLHEDLVTQSFGLSVNIPFAKKEIGGLIERSAPGKPKPVQKDPVTGMVIPGTGRSILQILKGKKFKIHFPTIKQGNVSAYDDDDLYLDFEIGLLIGGSASANLSEIWRRLKNTLELKKCECLN